jgi:hypothetical protein
VTCIQPKRAYAGLIGFLLCFTIAVPVAEAKDQSSQISPAELVRRAVQNEIAAGNASGPRFMFKNQRRTPRYSETKLIVETRDATAGLLVAVDDHPLNTAQRQAEEARLENYIHNPEQLNKKHKQEQEDAERTIKIMRALPDAFLYEADGTQPGTATIGQPGDELTRLKFRPNPNYNPPSHVEQVLTGMRGQLLIDPKENRIAEIDGTLEKEVGFGWGILGHLDRGGRFLVQQADIGNHVWELTRMELSFTGKVLFFKRLNIHSSDVFTDFRPVPNTLTFAQGVELLKKELAQNHPAVSPTGKQDDSKIQNAQTQIRDQAAENICCDR